MAREKELHYFQQLQNHDSKYSKNHSGNTERIESENIFSLSTVHKVSSDAR